MERNTTRPIPASRPGFRDLPPEEKLAARKKERDEKKDRQRTLAFFTAAQQALQSAASTHDSSSVSAMVESLVSELCKILRSDAELHILRNGTVCRAVETAFGLNSNLLSVKTVLYMLLGSISACAMSPTASFVLEALITNLTTCIANMHSLQSSDEVRDAMLASEVDPSGQGSQPGSGLPNVATLLQHVADEMCEAMDSLIVSDAGARCVRGLVLTLAGLPSHRELSREGGGAALAPTVGPSSSRPRFEGLCGSVIADVCESIERVFQPDNVAKPRRADAWWPAATRTASSVVLQSILRCGHPDGCPQVDIVVRSKLCSLQILDADGGKEPLLAALMRDAMGAHVFQACMRCPPSGSAFALLEAQEAAFDALCSAGAPSASKAFLEAIESGAKRKHHDTVQAADGPCSASWTASLLEHCASKLEDDSEYDCPWMVCYRLFRSSCHEMLAPESEKVRHAAFLLQDLATYCPSVQHLALLWREVLLPHLELLLQLPALTAVLVRFTRKCAFFVPSSVPYRNTPVVASPRGGDLALIQRDAQQGAIYFNVPVPFRKEVTAALLTGPAMKELCGTKSVPHALLVDQRLGEHMGFELMSNLLHFGAAASSVLVNAFDKLNLENLKFVAEHPQGAFVLQLWIQTAAQKASQSASPSANRGAARAPQGSQRGQKGKVDPKPQPPARSGTSSQSASTAAVVDDPGPPILRRMVHRLLPLTVELAQGKYSCHVVEALFDQSSMDLKEDIVKTLVPLLQSIKKTKAHHEDISLPERKRPRPDEAPSTDEAEELKLPDEASCPPSHFYATKVLIKLRVEQYVHRGEEWKAQAAKTAHVQRLMKRILALDSGN